jgi:phosphoribosylaminoimidazolecarboxamide formyltransferase/IMP cyclohydrolase
MSFNSVSKIDDLVPIRNAIISVSDKTGLADFARSLVDACPGVRVYSTGGTYRALKDVLGARAGETLVAMEEYTGQPEMKGGLVKTLDWKIYLGLLSEPYDADHEADRKRVGAVAFDMVVGNLYPFQAAAKAPGCFEGKRQNIDIGGPCMLRASAKNFLRVAGVCDPADYPAVLAELRERGGALSLATRKRLAAKVFDTTARYDAAIAGFLGSSDGASLDGEYQVARRG